MAEEHRQKFELRKIYVKDMSFESPMAPSVFRMTGSKPTIDIQLNVSHEDLGDDMYESVVRVTVSGKIDEKDAFVAEVHQAGVYEISGVEADKGLVAALEVSCPNMLFPFARETICDMVVRGGFPQLLLSPVNFEYLYKQKVLNEQSGDGVEGGNGESREAGADETPA